MDVRGLAKAYRTPLWLTAVFVVLLGVFAITPDPTTASSADAAPTAEPTPGPRECVVCPIDQRCDAKSGKCVFIKHTPLPCVRTAKFDDKAGFCLPEGVAPAPARAPATSPDPNEPDSSGGIGDGSRDRQPRLPGFGNSRNRD